VKRELMNSLLMTFGILSTPEGKVYKLIGKQLHDLVVDTSSIEEQKEEKKESDQSIVREKKKRGEKGLYSVQDQKWEQEMRKELEKKKLEVSGKTL